MRRASIDDGLSQRPIRHVTHGAGDDGDRVVPRSLTVAALAERDLTVAALAENRRDVECTDWAALGRLVIRAARERAAAEGGLGGVDGGRPA